MIPFSEVEFYFRIIRGTVPPANIPDGDTSATTPLAVKTTTLYSSGLPVTPKKAKYPEGSVKAVATTLLPRNNRTSSPWAGTLLDQTTVPDRKDPFWLLASGEIATSNIASVDISIAQPRNRDILLTVYL